MKIMILFSITIILNGFLNNCYALMPVVDYPALAKLGEELEQLEKQEHLLRQELKQLSNEQYQWSNAQSLINQLDTIMEQSRGIAYSAQDEQSQFQKNFPGYQAPSDLAQQYHSLTDVVLNTTQGSLQTYGHNNQDFTQENNRLAFLQNQVKTAQGQTQAIQAAAEIASEQVSQLQILRQTIMTEANAQATYYAAQTQKEASAQAQMDLILSNGDRNTTGILNEHPVKIPFQQQ